MKTYTDPKKLEQYQYAIEKFVVIEKLEKELDIDLFVLLMTKKGQAATVKYRDKEYKIYIEDCDYFNRLFYSNYVEELCGRFKLYFKTYRKEWWY